MIRSFFITMKAKSELKRSAVADNVSGKSKLSEVRTSSGMFISKAKVQSFIQFFMHYICIAFKS